MNPDENITDIESAEYKTREDGVRKFPRWMKVAGITAASVLAGGFAATWIYRKSIARLQNPEDAPEYSNSHRTSGETDDES